MYYIAIACGCLAVCFIVSAFVVRFAPNSISATHIEMRLWMFLALPVLLILDMLLLVGDLAVLGVRQSSILFETLSGKRRGNRKTKHYGYFSYGVAPTRQRRSFVERRAARSRQQRRRLRA